MTFIYTVNLGAGAARAQLQRRLLTAVLFALSGCMVGPDYKRPETPMPAAYGELVAALVAPAPDPGAEEVTWWRRFGDAELTSLVERAVAANNGVAVAEARLREARAGREIAQSMLYPQIGVGASVLRFKASQAALGVPGGLLELEDNLFQVGFDAVWVADVFGGIRRTVESAEANEQAAAAARRGVVLMVAAETARAYVELRGTQRELEVARTTLREQRQTLAATEEKRRNGLSSDLEVLRARTEVESSAAEIPPLEHSIRQYIHVLSTLLALEPTALSNELERAAPVPNAPGTLTVGIPSDLLRRRPDIQAAERQLAAATAQVGIATAQLFPQVVLGGAAGLASRGTGDLFNASSSRNPSSYYAVGPFINWTIFDGGRRKAGIELSEAQVDAAKASYQETVLRAFREVESALVAVDRARVRLEDLTRLSESARESAEIARRDYRNGILDQLTVLDAQRQSDRAEMLLTQGQIAVTTSMVLLYKALGGGWVVAEPAPQQPATKP